MSTPVYNNRTSMYEPKRSSYNELSRRQTTASHAYPCVLHSTNKYLRYTQHPIPTRINVMRPDFLEKGQQSGSKNNDVFTSHTSGSSHNTWSRVDFPPSLTHAYNTWCHTARNISSSKTCRCTITPPPPPSIHHVQRRASECLPFWVPM